MAWTWTDRGGFTGTTSSTTFACVPSGTLASGSLAVLIVAADNSPTSGLAQSTYTVTDTNGNLWVRWTNPLNDPGAANAGVEGAVWTTDMAAGALDGTDTITITWGTAVAAKAAMLFEAVPTSGYKAQVRGAGQGTGSGTTPTITTIACQTGDLVICGGHTEYGTSNTWTADADTTNGTWSAQQTARAGSTAGGQGVGWQSKEVTADGTQTYNPGFSASCDYCLSWIRVAQVKTRGDMICGTIPAPR